MSDKKKGGLFDSLKHAFVEDIPDATAPAPHPVAATSILTSSASASGFSTATGLAASTEDAAGSGNDEAYKRLVDKSNFDSTDVGLTILSYYKKLEAVPETVMTASTKQTTAVLQAKAEVGGDRILAAFDNLKAVIAAEEQKFTAKAADYEAKQITARQNRITEIQSQITSLQAEMQRTAADLTESQGRAAKASAAFRIAVQRRNNELDQQKVNFAALLK